MTNTQNTRDWFASRRIALKGFGRGVAVSSAVALLGVGTLSAADASAAGVSHGVRFANSTVTHPSKPEATDVSAMGTSQYALRDGRLQRIE